MMTFSLLTSPVCAATIRLLPEVQMRGALVRLGDIAEIAECDEVTQTQLEEITIGPAPAVGREFRIPLDTVRRELALRGVDQTQLRFAGASECLVTQSRPQAIQKQVAPVANQQIVEYIENAVRIYLSRQASDSGTFEVTLDKSSASSLPAELTLRHALTVQGGQQPWTGMQRLTITYTSDQETPVDFPVTCSISQKPRLLALKHGLPRGQVIREIDLIWIDTETETDGFSDPVAVVGTETAKNIRALAAIQADDIRMLPLVRRNDIVAVTAQIGTISVMRYCKCHEEGTLGQFVSLSPLDSKERVVARVSGYRAAIISMNDQTMNQPAAQVNPNRSESNRNSVTTTGLELIASEKSEQTTLNTNSIRQTSGVSQPTSRISPTSKSARVLANQPAQLP